MEGSKNKQTMEAPQTSLRSVSGIQFEHRRSGPVSVNERGASPNLRVTYLSTEKPYSVCIPSHTYLLVRHQSPSEVTGTTRWEEKERPETYLVQ